MKHVRQLSLITHIEHLQLWNKLDNSLSSLTLNIYNYETS